jgi:hypothetical protein
MMSQSRRFARILSLAVLILAGLCILSQTPARAETSYHKLKVRLRKTERTSGEVLEVAGDVAGQSLLYGSVMILSGMLGCEVEDAPTISLWPSHPSEHKSASAPPVNHTKPDEPKHHPEK